MQEGGFKIFLSDLRDGKVLPKKMLKNVKKRALELGCGGVWNS